MLFWFLPLLYELFVLLLRSFSLLYELLALLFSLPFVCCDGATLRYWLFPFTPLFTVFLSLLLMALFSFPAAGLRVPPFIWDALAGLRVVLPVAGLALWLPPILLMFPFPASLYVGELFLFP